MIRAFTLATVLASAFALSAVAQDNTKPVAVPSINAPPMSASPMPTGAIFLSEQEAKGWVDKPVYSSDGKKLGEVVVFERDPGNQVLSMHADIGGFLGMMQTRVRIMPAQFKLQVDRIVLDMTAEQAKGLPKVQA